MRKLASQGLEKLLAFFVIGEGCCVRLSQGMFELAKSELTTELEFRASEFGKSSI